MSVPRVGVTVLPGEASAVHRGVGRSVCALIEVRGRIGGRRGGPGGQRGRKHHSRRKDRECCKKSRSIFHTSYEGKRRASAMVSPKLPLTAAIVRLLGSSKTPFGIDYRQMSVSKP